MMVIVYYADIAYSAVLCGIGDRNVAFVAKSRILLLIFRGLPIGLWGRGDNASCIPRRLSGTEVFSIKRKLVLGQSTLAIRASR